MNGHMTWNLELGTWLEFFIPSLFLMDALDLKLLIDDMLIFFLIII
jgi:hypothetical protein